MNTENSWSKEDLIPANLSKKENQKITSLQRESDGFEEENTFGKEKRKCKIFLKKKDIDELDKKVKQDMSKSNQEYNDAKKKAEETKKNQLNNLSKYQDQINDLVNGNDKTESLKQQIDDSMKKLKNNLIPIIDNFNQNAMSAVNDVYNPTIEKIIKDHHDKIKPILEKFNKYGNFANIGEDYQEMIEQISKKSEINEINDVVKDAAVNSDPQVDEALQKSELYNAFKSTEEIFTESIKECNDNICPSNELEQKLNKILGKNDIVNSIENAVKDGTSKKTLTPLNTKQIINKLTELKFDLDSKLDNAKDEVESQSTIFSKRKAKISEITLALKNNIDSVTKFSEMNISLAKKTLFDKINQLRKERDTNVKEIMKTAHIILNNKLKSIDDQANAIYKLKEVEIKSIEQEYENAIKKAEQDKKEAIKNYSYMLEKPIDGIAYFKSMSGGLIGKKSRHEFAKIMGIKNEVSMIGANSLVIIYIRENESKTQTTSVTNVCILKE